MHYHLKCVQFVPARGESPSPFIKTKDDGALRYTVFDEAWLHRNNTMQKEKYNEKSVIANGCSRSSDTRIIFTHQHRQR